MTLTELLVAMIVLALATVTLQPILQTAGRANKISTSSSQQMLGYYQLKQTVQGWAEDISFLESQLPDIKLTKKTMRINTYDGQSHQLELKRQEKNWHVLGSEGLDVELAVAVKSNLIFSYCNSKALERVAIRRICIEQDGPEMELPPVMIFRILTNRSPACDFDMIGRRCL